MDHGTGSRSQIRIETVLNEVMDVLAVGDDAPVPVLERPWVQQVRDEPGARPVSGYGTAASSSAGWRRCCPSCATRQAPTRRWPEQWRINQHERYLAHRPLAEILAAKKALRPGLTVQNAADIIFTLVSPEVYLLLTVERRWSPAQWQRWLTSTIAHAVLR